MNKYTEKLIKVLVSDDKEELQDLCDEWGVEARCVRGVLQWRATVCRLAYHVRYQEETEGWANDTK